MRGSDITDHKHLESGRGMEIDALNRALVRKAESLGISVAVNPWKLRARLNRSSRKAKLEEFASGRLAHERKDPVMTQFPALMAAEIGPPARETNYPEPFASRVAGREKRRLGDAFGLVNYGVNLTRLAPGAVSALRHWHTKQDEFVYILEGCPTLVTNAGRTSMQPGMCAGFKSGTENAHHLLNETNADVIYLEIGDRPIDDEAIYPDDDLKVSWLNGKWGRAMHKDGTPY